MHPCVSSYLTILRVGVYALHLFYVDTWLYNVFCVIKHQECSACSVCVNTNSQSSAPRCVTSQDSAAVGRDESNTAFSFQELIKTSLASDQISYRCSCGQEINYNEHRESQSSIIIVTQTLRFSYGTVFADRKRKRECKEGL